MEFTFRINKSIDDTFVYLTDMQKFVSVHPIITKIEKRNSGYLVYETVKVGFIPISFTYPVTVDHNYEEKSIVIKAIVLKFTKIEMSFKLYSDQGLTNVHETIRIKSVLPIKSIMKRVFKVQHGLLFKNIEQAK